jgi:hypothetical protein
VEGTITDSEPSFKVEVASTVGNVRPPSVDNRILTAWQFTDPALVPFTFHVTVAALPELHVILLLGDVTWKGPAVLVTVTTTSVKAVCPTATGATELKVWLSRTVNLKLSVLDTELNASIFAPASPPAKGGVTFKPANIVDNFGNNLVPDTTGAKESQFGPVVLVGEATLAVAEVVELSFCSQQ